NAIATARRAKHPPHPVLDSVSMTPAAVVGGLGATLTVKLSDIAPNDGTTVLLSSDAPAVVVPAYVSFVPGSKLTNAQVQVSSIATATTATIRARLGDQVLVTSLSILPAAVSAVSANPQHLIGGQAGIGQVTLSGPAPGGGTPVQLTSSSPALLEVPA